MTCLFVYHMHDSPTVIMVVGPPAKQKKQNTQLYVGDSNGGRCSLAH